MHGDGTGSGLPGLLVEAAVRQGLPITVTNRSPDSHRLGRVVWAYVHVVCGHTSSHQLAYPQPLRTIPEPDLLLIHAARETLPVQHGTAQYVRLDQTPVPRHQICVGGA